MEFNFNNVSYPTQSRHNPTLNCVRQTQFLNPEDLTQVVTTEGEGEFDPQSSNLGGVRNFKDWSPSKFFANDSEIMLEQSSFRFSAN